VDLQEEVFIRDPENEFLGTIFEDWEKTRSDVAEQELVSESQLRDFR
jgi:hypothetical protein